MDSVIQTLALNLMRDLTSTLVPLPGVVPYRTLFAFCLFYLVVFSAFQAIQPYLGK